MWMQATRGNKINPLPIPPFSPYHETGPVDGARLPQSSGYGPAAAAAAVVVRFPHNNVSSSSSSPPSPSAPADHRAVAFVAVVGSAVVGPPVRGQPAAVGDDDVRYAVGELGALGPTLHLRAVRTRGRCKSSTTTRALLSQKKKKRKKQRKEKNAEVHSYFTARGS